MWVFGGFFKFVGRCFVNLLQLYQVFAQVGISLIITKKFVKNVNFRMRLGECRVSVPAMMSEAAIVSAVLARLDWAVCANRQLAQRQRTLKYPQKTLWGRVVELPDDQVLAVYRQSLNQVIPALQAKWQPIVGKSPKQIRLKKMTTRWGTCNPADQRIWLSIYLAAYPYECTEYVFVHELCHLIHANHSVAFWAEVEKAMPDYKKWHGLLRGREID